MSDSLLSEESVEDSLSPSASSPSLTRMQAHSFYQNKDINLKNKNKKRGNHHHQGSSLLALLEVGYMSQSWLTSAARLPLLCERGETLSSSQCLFPAFIPPSLLSLLLAILTCTHFH